ncbi:MAG: C25 family cysteine peptidase [Candidatus Vogelbacteria bacterium]
MKKYIVGIIFVTLVILGLIIWGGSNNTPAYDSKSIAVFSDTHTYQTLKVEIDQYILDVQKDTGSVVKLFADDFKKPEQVRNKLQEIYSQGLQGSILIGEVPIPYFESPGEFIGGGGNLLPSDRYYMDLESSDFIDEDNNGKYELEKYGGRYSKNLPDNLLWVGRIKSYGNDIELLRAYFQRNHLYRTNKINPVKSLLVYSMDTQSGPVGATMAIYENNIKDSFFRTGLYSKEQVSLIVDTPKSVFLNEMSKSYETASINAHGNATSQQIGEGITPADIKNSKPKPYFYYLLSCVNGDFSKKDYLAGHYLLDGNGLVVIAHTIQALAGADEAKNYMAYLAQGDNFGVAFVKVQKRVNEMHATLIGDPTLKM